MTCKCSTTDVLDIEARSRYFPRLPLFSTTKPFDIHLNSLIYIWTMWIPQFTQFYSVQLFEFSMSVVSFIQSSWYNWHVMHLDYMGMLHFRQLTQDFYFLWMLTSLVVAPFCWRFFCEVRLFWRYFSWPLGIRQKLGNIDEQFQCHHYPASFQSNILSLPSRHLRRPFLLMILTAKSSSSSSWPSPPISAADNNLSSALGNHWDISNKRLWWKIWNWKQKGVLKNY